MALTKKQRAILREKFGGKCAYCGDELPPRWYVDLFDGEVVPCCQQCCIYKNGADIETFRGMLLKNLMSQLNRSMALKAAYRFGLMSVTPSRIVFWCEKYHEIQVD